MGNFAFLAINAWPSAFLPSTFEDAEDRAIRFGNKCRDRVDNPVKVLAELGKATREGGIKRRIAADVHVEAAHGVRHLHALQRHPELLRTVPPLGVEVGGDRACEQHRLLRRRTAS